MDNDLCHEYVFLKAEQKESDRKGLRDRISVGHIFEVVHTSKFGHTFKVVGEEMTLIEQPPVKAISRYRELVRLGGCQNSIREDSVKSFAFLVGRSTSLAVDDGDSIITNSQRQPDSPPQLISFESILSSMPGVHSSAERLVQVRRAFRRLASVILAL